jgi:hypothetical protein
MNFYMRQAGLRPRRDRYAAGRAAKAKGEAVGVLAALRTKNLLLHRGFEKGKTVWWTSDNSAVCEETAQAVVASDEVEAIGDSLFADASTQSFRPSPIRLP